jgi:AcrR family transcriptional regulator
MTTAAGTPRKLSTADDRREELLAAARAQFARRGYYGTPTTDIAKAAGISQAYLFRLFPTKEELFVACVQRTLDVTRGEFTRAAAPHAGDSEAVLEAMGQRYDELLQQTDLLLGQLHAYAACQEPAVREAVRAGYGRLVEMVRDLSGAPDERIQEFFAKGMLINVIAAMGAHELDEPWARALMTGHEGC